MGFFEWLARIFFDPIVNLIFPKERFREVRRQGFGSGMRNLGSTALEMRRQGQPHGRVPPAQQQARSQNRQFSQVPRRRLAVQQQGGRPQVRRIGTNALPNPRILQAKRTQLRRRI
ncbi:MAG TPA: hypothetical protein VI977_00755 [archaeon]|nr:hypothetical protein [archaeon]